MGDARNRTFAISYILFLVASSHAAWSQPKRDHDDIFWGLGQVSPAASAPVEDNPSWPPRFASNHDRDSFFVGKLALALRAKERCGKHLAPMFYMVFAVAKIEGMSDQASTLSLRKSPKLSTAFVTLMMRATFSGASW